jgi:Activator of Hsp90 ATPase homolog 1-like protein
MTEAAKAVFRIFIRASQEVIFRELTKAGVPQGAVFNAVLTLASPGLAVGKQLQMRTVSGKHTLVAGEIVALEPPHRFVHTHRFTQHQDPVCTVSYELRPLPGGTEVTLTVENLIPNSKTANEMQRGGTFILGNLKSITETGRPPLATRLMYWMFDKLEFVLPGSTRTEHWPLREG